VSGDHGGKDVAERPPAASAAATHGWERLGTQRAVSVTASGSVTAAVAPSAAAPLIVSVLLPPSPASRVVVSALRSQ
jgi:hypothetical protein